MIFFAWNEHGTQGIVYNRHRAVSGCLVLCRDASTMSEPELDRAIVFTLGSRCCRSDDPKKLHPLHRFCVGCEAFEI